MSESITALDVQHDSTAVETDASADFDESAETFGDDDDVDVFEAPLTCYLLSC